MEKLLHPSAEEPKTAHAAEAAAETSDGTDVGALAAERDRALSEKEELWDRFVRKQAEFENFRKRMAREKEEVLQFAAMEIVRSLLPVLDDLERALKTPASDDEFRRGIELIHKRFGDTLLQAGLTPIDSVGKKFDPHLHQAVDTVSAEAGKDRHEDQIIVEEYQRGYEFKGRLLRPAMVKVAVRE